MCLSFVHFCCVTVMPVKPGCSSSGDVSTQITPVMSPNQGDSSPSPHYNGDLPGSSHSSTNRHFSFTPMPSSASHSDLPPRGHPSSQPPRPIRATHPPGHRVTNGVRAPSPSIHLTLNSSSKSKGMPPSHSQSKKAPTKPMWVDVSVLPRIPKIKRESSDITNDGTSQGGSTSSSSRGNSSNSITSSNGFGMAEMGMNSLAGDKGRQQSVDQQKGRADGQAQRQRPDGQAQRQRPDGAGSSSAFSNSFSSSSSSTGSPASQPHYSSSSSSSSSAVSFRINSSGNSWHSRRLSTPSSSASGGNVQEPRREKENEARKRQLHRDKQMLLASRTLGNKEQDSNSIYDPFNPTLSDSSNSDDEAESTSLDGRFRPVTHEGKAPSLGNKKGIVQSKQHLVRVKTETQEIEISEEEPRRASAQVTISQEVKCSEEHIKVEKESRLVHTETQTAFFDTKVKKEPGLDDAGEAERFGHSVKSLNSETTDTTPPVHHSLDRIKTERETGQSAGTPNSAPPNCKNDSSASSSAPTKKKQKAETKSDSKSCSKSPSRDLGHKKKTFHALKERHSSSPETDRGRRGDHHASSQGGRQKEREKDRERSSRRSRSREKRRARSTSGSSQSNSPDRTCRKRQRSRSRSKDRRRSR